MEQILKYRKKYGLKGYSSKEGQSIQKPIYIVTDYNNELDTTEINVGIKKRNRTAHGVSENQVEKIQLSRGTDLNTHDGEIDSYIYLKDGTVTTGKITLQNILSMISNGDRITSDDNNILEIRPKEGIKYYEIYQINKRNIYVGEGTEDSKGLDNVIREVERVEVKLKFGVENFEVGSIYMNQKTTKGYIYLGEYKKEYIKGYNKKEGVYGVTEKSLYLFIEIDEALNNAYGNYKSNNFLTEYPTEESSKSKWEYKSIYSLLRCEKLEEPCTKGTRERYIKVTPTNIESVEEYAKLHIDQSTSNGLNIDIIEGYYNGGRSITIDEKVIEKVIKQGYKLYRESVSILKRVIDSGELRKEEYEKISKASQIYSTGGIYSYKLDRPTIYIISVIEEVLIRSLNEHGANGKLLRGRIESRGINLLGYLNLQGGYKLRYYKEEDKEYYNDIKLRPGTQLLYEEPELPKILKDRWGMTRVQKYKVKTIYMEDKKMLRGIGKIPNLYEEHKESIKQNSIIKEGMKIQIGKLLTRLMREEESNFKDGVQLSDIECVIYRDDLWYDKLIDSLFNLEDVDCSLSYSANVFTVGDKEEEINSVLW